MIEKFACGKLNFLHVLGNGWEWIRPHGRGWVPVGPSSLDHSKRGWVIGGPNLPTGSLGYPWAQVSYPVQDSAWDNVSTGNCSDQPFRPSLNRGHIQCFHVLQQFAH